jgi:hypothetical protein
MCQSVCPSLKIRQIGTLPPHLHFIRYHCNVMQCIGGVASKKVTLKEISGRVKFVFLYCALYLVVAIYPVVWVSHGEAQYNSRNCARRIHSSIFGSFSSSLCVTPCRRAHHRISASCSPENLVSPIFGSILQSGMSHPTNFPSVFASCDSIKTSCALHCLHCTALCILCTALHCTALHCASRTPVIQLQQITAPRPNKPSLRVQQPHTACIHNLLPFTRVVTNTAYQALHFSYTLVFRPSLQVLIILSAPVSAKSSQMCRDQSTAVTANRHFHTRHVKYLVFQQSINNILASNNIHQLFLLNL